MQTYELLPDQIRVEKSEETTGKEKVSVTRYTAYDETTGDDLGSIHCVGGLIPCVKLINVGVGLERDVLLLGRSTKADSRLKLIGKHGTHQRKLCFILD